VLLEVIRGLTRSVRRLNDQLRVRTVPAPEVVSEDDEVSEGDLPPRSRRL
jgi:hypothetical protein